MKRGSPEEKYKDIARRQQRILEEYAEHEFEWAGDLLLWYKIKNLDMPEDEYRACAFFQNREYRKKPGALSLLYQMYNRCTSELPTVTRENAFDLLRFQFKMYAKVLQIGGFS
ncbi:hypothetical protein [Treponema sp. R80B11-R83G3]